MGQVVTQYLCCSVQTECVPQSVSVSGVKSVLGRDIAHHDLLSTEVLSSSAVSSEQRGTVQSRALGPYWDMVRR